MIDFQYFVRNSYVLALSVSVFYDEENDTKIIDFGYNKEFCFYFYLAQQCHFRKLSRHEPANHAWITALTEL